MLIFNYEITFSVQGLSLSAFTFTSPSTTSARKVACVAPFTSGTLISTGFFTP